jgi:hypothetical protein
MITIDDFAQRRNALLLRAEGVSKKVADQCWTRLGVTNRHIEGVLAGIFPLSRIVEDEIVRCCEAVEVWLAASHKQSS